MYQSKFVKLLEEADKIRTQGDRTRAFAKYKQALTVFNDREDELESYFQGKISMCEIQRDNGDYNGSRREFQNILKDIDTKIKQEEYSAKKAKKQKFKIIHNLAKLQLAFSYNFSIDEDIENYKSYRCKMNDSFGYFKQAFAIVVDSLLKDTTIQSSWGNDYMRTKSNYLQLLYQEGEEFDNKQQIQQIFQEVKNAKKFYQAHKIKQRQIDLYRCYYYKAIALKAVGKLQDCYKLLKMDYDFEKKNNQLDDADKSRKQLFSICLDINNLKEAEAYARQSSKKDIIKQVTKRRERIQEYFAMPQQTLKKCTVQRYDQLFSDFNLLINIYHYDLVSMDKQIDRVLQLYRSNSATRATLYYYSSQCNYRLKNYQKAQKMISQAIKISSSDEVQLRDWKIQRLKIMTMTSFDYDDLREQYEKLLREVTSRLKNQRNQERKKQLGQQLVDLKFSFNKMKKIQLKARQNQIYSFSSQKEKQLLEKIEKIKKGIKQITPNQISQYSLQNYSIIPQSQQNYNKKQQKLIFNPVQNYKNTCKQQNILCRQLVKQNIQNNTPSRFFSQFINLSSEELLLLISTLNYQDLDLRNHVVDNKIFGEILSRNPQLSLRSLKIDGINQIQAKKILQLLMIVRDVSQLHFVNFSAHKCSPFYEIQKNKQIKQQTRPSNPPRSLTHALFLLPFTQSQFKAENIRVLKLKYCNLTDNHFRQLDLQAYYSIEELNLSHNLLQGRQLASVITLPHLIKLCLSGNPLKTLSFENWKHIIINSNFTLAVLKLKEIQFNLQISQQLIYIFARVHCLNISRAKSVENLIKALYDALFQDKMIKIQTWIMKEVNFGNNPQLSQMLSYVLRKMSISIIDLRLCSYDDKFAEFLNQIETNQGKIIKKGEGLDFINVNSFDLYP